MDHSTRRASAGNSQARTDQVQSRLRDVVHKLREHLQGALALLEDDHVVPDEIIALQRVAQVGEHFQLGFGRLAVVQTEMVARFQVHRDGAIRVCLFREAVVKSRVCGSTNPRNARACR